MNADLGASSKRRWFAIGIADFLFLFVVYCVLVTAQKGLLDDPGVGWHLRHVDAMFEVGGWLHGDPFTRTRLGQPWLTNQWIGDGVMRAGYWWGGLEGIAVVAALSLGFIYRSLYVMLLKDGSAWPIALMWTYLAALGTSPGWVARPNIATYGFVLLIARICVLFHEGRCSRKWTLWVFPVFVLWANTHGGFLAGLIILAMTLAVEIGVALLGSAPENRNAARIRARHVSLLLGGSVVCTFINPYGPGLYAFVLGLLGNDYFMGLNTEWHSADFHPVESFRYELLLLLFPALLAVSRFRASLVSIGLSVLWLHFALNSRRYIPLWILVSIPLMARCLLEITWFKEMFRKFPISPSMVALLSSHRVRTTWLGSLVVVLGSLGWAHWETEFARHREELIAVDACEFLLDHCGGDVVFHEYNWGGYLTWQGWDRNPRFLNWIDDRNEAQGEAHTRDYISILLAEENWQNRLAEENIKFICIKPDTPMARLLIDPNYRLEQNWVEIYRDEFAVIFERHD